ncbi:carbohydrate-binding protein [Rubritalea spongiae]|uniref:Carbohydrate-binding protein n=1 Tax=Rubritalea spongiae TaxID=430797 RepID=A0ABW5E1Y1_9BACT
MNKTTYWISACMAALGLAANAEVLYQDNFDNDGLSTNTGIGGGAINNTIHAHSWDDDGDATFHTAGTSYTRRALLYSENTFQSDTGFKLTLSFTTGSISDLAAHNLSFGLISNDTNLSNYSGYNPFRTDTSVYSIGANVTSDGEVASRGLNFTNGSSRTTLDQSGTRAQFQAGESCEVTIEIGIGGYWCYRINGVYEASGVLVEGFDLSKNYHVAVYGQDDHGGGKSIQSIQLETAYAAGERAASMRGSWCGGENDLENVKNFKTLDTLSVGFTSGASQSALHFAPHKLLETIALEGVNGQGPAIDYVVAPSWGDLTQDSPETDELLDKILDIKAAGFKVKAYTNCETFVGTNGDTLQEFVDRWKDYCDNDPTMQAFINSQPFHTGIWNRTTQQYEDASATYPDRKYLFCYAEFILKDYALRYGPHIGSWIFDDGSTMGQNGDNATSGLVEEQRLYQAFANAVRAGNPECPIAFNNGRSNVNYDAFPYAHPVRFEDFTFGHAFGGNNDHASKTGSQFNNNYNHITRMTATNGYVHDGGNWAWDDLIVGNFHSKLSTTAWNYGTVQAWEEADFFQWNLEAMQAGGHMTWSGSIWRSNPTLQPWALTLLQGLDEHLAQFQNPGAPNWARAYTILPDAVMGEPYRHVLVEGIDLWDPEGDEIDIVWLLENVPSWLTITEDTVNDGHWILSGTPTETETTDYSFAIRARDVNIDARSRSVELRVGEDLNGDGDLNVVYNAAHFDDESHPSSDSKVKDEGTNIGFIQNNTWVAYHDFDFDIGAQSIEMSVSSTSTGGTIEIRIGSPTGELISSIDIDNTQSYDNYQLFSGNISNYVTGIHDLYFVFVGTAGYLYNVADFIVNAGPPSDLGVHFNAVGYDEESAPNNANEIRNLESHIGYITSGSWVAYKEFNFALPSTQVEVFAASNTSGGTVEVRLGSPTGTLITSIDITNTSGWSNFITFTAQITNPPTGLHDLYFVFQGGNDYLLDIQSFKIE